MQLGPYFYFQFVAVASKDHEKAKKLAEEFNFQKAYGSYDELAQDKDVGTCKTIHFTNQRFR